MSLLTIQFALQCGEKHLAKCGSGKKKGVDVEFIPLQVRGQSFMIHQIRKMIGLIVAVVRGHAQEEIMTRVFKKPKVDIPRAPALGLLLDNVSATLVLCRPVYNYIDL